MAEFPFAFPSPIALDGPKTALGFTVVETKDIPLVNTNAGLPDGWRTRGGIHPIDWARLLPLCGLTGEDMRTAEPYWQYVVAAQQQKTLGRKSYIGATVYDDWGMLNPPNTLALAAILIALKNASLEVPRILFLGTGAGQSELIAWHLLGDRVETRITTVDVVKDSPEGREYAPTLVPIDRQNLDYGPVTERGNGWILREGLKTGRLPAASFDMVWGDSIDFLRRYSGPPFHLIVVDSNHSYHQVLLELALAWPHLADSGVMFIDDWGVDGKIATQGGVTEGALEFARRARQIGYFINSPADPPELKTQTAFFLKCRELSYEAPPESYRRILEEALAALG